MKKRFDIVWAIAAGVMCAVCIGLALMQKDNTDAIGNAWLCGFFCLTALADVFAARPRVRWAVRGFTVLLMAGAIAWFVSRFVGPAGSKIVDLGLHPTPHWSAFSGALADGLAHWDNHLMLLYGAAFGAVCLWYLMLRKAKR